MRKILLALLLAAVTVIGGCTTKNVDQKETTIPQKETVMEQVKLSELIPDPKEYFFNTEFEMITSEDCYSVYLDYASEDEWNNYISKCKEEGFWENETYLSDYSWYVISKDKKYQLYLDRYGDKNEYMTIIVKYNGSK